MFKKIEKTNQIVRTFERYRRIERYSELPTWESYKKPGHFSRSLAKGATTTTWFWNLHADAHDFDVHVHPDGRALDRGEISTKLFGAHFGQVRIILIWLSGAYFHGAKFSNYLSWLEEPTRVKPIAQRVWRVVGQEILNADLGGSGGEMGIQTTAGFFQLWRASGITSTLQLYATSLTGLLVSGRTFWAGWFHFHKYTPRLGWFQDAQSMMKNHLTGVIGLGRIAWAGHQIHIAAPINCILDAGLPASIIPPAQDFMSCEELILYSREVPVSSIMTQASLFNPRTGGLWIIDEAYHHAAIGVMFVWAGHLYRSYWRGGRNIKDILIAHRGPITGRGHRGLYEIMTCSWHAQLAVNLSTLGSLSILVSHHIYAIPPYPYLATDYRTRLSLFTHHMWIGGFCIVGGGAHASIFIVRDYDPKKNHNNVLDRVIRHRDTIISHLNWISIFLGFHSFGLYIHNDTMSSLGRPQDIFRDSAIQLQPVFAQWLQTQVLYRTAGSHAILSSLYQKNDALIPRYKRNYIAVCGKVAWIPIPIGTADFMVHHVHAFTIHVTALIILKGVLYARNSRLIPDKANLGFRFPCDGPGRGGTCQVSAWDHIFLALFWMYNTISVVIFHFSWKIQSDVWGNVSRGTISHITGGNFAQSANTINGWLRDFLWAQSSQVIQSYGSALSAYGLLFLGAHFVWAFSLIFLFSGRGYWQELIESIVWAHNKLKVAPIVPPRALSITQGRAVGVSHYLLGGIVTTWSFFLARIIAVG